MQESARTALTWLRTKRPALRTRPVLPPPHRRPPARRLRRGAQRRGDRRRRHGRRARLGVHGTSRERRPCHDRRDRPRRAGAPGRRRPRKALAAHRCGLDRVLQPRRNAKECHEELGDDLRRAIAVEYVSQLDELLKRGCGAKPRRPALCPWPSRTPACPEPSGRRALDTDATRRSCPRDRIRPASVNVTSPRAGLSRPQPSPYLVLCHQ